MAYQLLDPQSLQPITESGEPVTAEGETWRWKALYENNITLWQFNDANNRFRRFAEIDQTRLTRFVMYSPFYPHTFSLDFDPSYMKLVHFYRRGNLRITTDPTTNEGFNHAYHFYVFGYEDKRDNSKHLVTINQKGNLIMTKDQSKYAYEQAYADYLESRAA